MNASLCYDLSRIRIRFLHILSFYQTVTINPTLPCDIFGFLVQPLFIWNGFWCFCFLSHFTYSTHAHFFFFLLVFVRYRFICFPSFCLPSYFHPQSLGHRSCRTVSQSDKQCMVCVRVWWEESCLGKHWERKVCHTWLQLKCLQSIYSDRPTSKRRNPITCSVANNTCTALIDIQNMHQNVFIQRGTAWCRGSVDWTWAKKPQHAQFTSTWQVVEFQEDYLWGRVI